MSHAHAYRPMSVAEFDAFNEQQPEDARWELIDGRLVAMTNPTDLHSQLVTNLALILGQAALRHGCYLDIGGMAVEPAAKGFGLDKTLPDLLVRCQALHPNATSTTEPCIVVEVLSASTARYDRGAKMAFYQSIEAMRDILLVYQDEMRVEHFTRSDDGAWRMLPLTVADAFIALRGLDLRLTLGAVYARTDLV